MAKAKNNYLQWCLVKLGKDMNWWVEEVSDSIHWETDGLSIIDPRQLQHILEQLETLKEYGLRDSIIEAAFVPFSINEELKGGKIKLVKYPSSLFNTEEMLFALPNTLNDERNAYTEFLDHLTFIYVKMLNDVYEFKNRLTIEELEDEIREGHHNLYMEGKNLHAFQEVMDILEYMPVGYERDEVDPNADADSQDDNNEIVEGFDEEIEEENIDEDDTMKWEDEDSQDEDSVNKNFSRGFDDETEELPPDE